MITRIARIAVATGALVVALASPGLAQITTNLGGLTPDNVKGYLAPLSEGLAATLNTGVFHTGGIPFAGLNFSIGFQGVGMTFDDEDNTFTPKDAVGFVSGGPPASVVGSTAATTMTRADNSAVIFPGGLDVSQLVLPVPQVSIGSVMGTRAVLRWAKGDTNQGDLGEVSLLGIGVQHSLSHYLTGLPLDLAAGAMYQTFTIGDDKLIDSKAIHADITASKKLSPFLQPYASIGYDTFSMEVNYDQDIGGGATQKTNVKFDDVNSFHGTAGVQVGFGGVSLNAQVDTAARTSMALGLRYGFGI